MQISHAAPQVWKPCSRVLKLAVPSALQNLSSYCVGIIFIIAAGRLGEFQLAVVLLASSLYNNTGCVFMYGFSNSIETIGGAAAGAGDHQAIAVALHQAAAICTFTSVLVMLSWTYVGSLLAWFVTDAAMVADTARCVWVLSPALWATGMAECLKRYLIVQDDATPPMVATAAATLLMPVYCWYLMFHHHLGVLGAALAFDIAMLTNLLFLLGYVVHREWRLYGTTEDSALWCLSRKLFSGLWTSFSLGLHSSLMLALEWWSFAIVMLWSGRLPDPKVSVSVMGIGNNLEEMLYMFACGFGTASGTLVAQYLGAQEAIVAKRYAGVTTAVTAAVQGIIALAVYLTRYPIGRAFSTSDKVIEGVATMMPVLSLLILVDGLTATLGGILRGAGKPAIGAIINLPAHWAIGLPAAYLMGFRAGWGVSGLWGGMLCAAFVQMVAKSVVILLFKWDRLAGEAASLLGKMASDAQADIELAVGNDMCDGSADDEQTALLSGSDGAKVGDSGLVGPMTTWQLSTAVDER